ncbi:MAG: hypothetical protein VX727_06245, partial [Planctomycetota bacterium]|nr:hypothetical protein [Planctomycetota bacterium]
WWFSERYWVNVGVMLPLMVGSQVLFLLPLAPVRLTSGRPSSLRGSILVAGFAAAFLSLVLALGVFGLAQLLGGWLDEGDVAFLPFTDFESPSFLNTDAWEHWAFLVPLAFLLASWAVWSIPISRFLRRGQPLDRFSRLTGLLLAGTLVELLLLIPLEALLRRRSDCYCSTGSFQGLVGALAACLWLLGPGIFLLLANRRPAWWKQHCQRCGYPRSGSRSPQCPECGWDWSGT